ncbi:MAG TPA: 50S ribosomal protein L1 [Candidatus Babeliaceae bacterium]|nr:50S ribosomal protein L1 [Candidatus Babeliaceae bacterium]
MTKHGKKFEAALDKVDTSKIYSLSEGIEKVKQLAYAKFNESVDAHINLGIDASKGEQAVRGSVILPHGTGKKIRVVVFAKGDYAEEAKKAGADYIGVEDLVDKIAAGWTEFDYAVATPDLMGLVGKLAKILGPKGLLPNKKVGTVTFDVADIVSDLKKGRVFFKNDKSGLVHFTFGKISFDPEMLRQNLVAFLKALSAAKPPASKGKFLKKLTITSTMGVGIPVNSDDVLRV